MAYNIVLVEPEIHTNTGNIGRLSLASGSNLHLVKPFGFEITDARLKRAGLDYWQHLDVHIYENIEEFYTKNTNKKMVYLTSKSQKSYTEIPFEDELFLVFGKESVGLSAAITDAHKEDLYTIPMFSEHIRSLNLANAVSIVVYEGIRRLQ
ncbi:tRNA (cytidine(34)-2'-O)-methyltransferase [Kordia sp. SMS9]|uniref:tRNA (cytidine(34)-2'-O)-methyltransferase n=1 Tax=Kordia sp. SMS9 TaxID=2282170 RepID=UPI000E0D3CD1|nr:tRNA (cytidine(34)-2'-O)-methyltransferase [Kordia sp. SMS9]AXG72336.1 tRNA (cytidine(34)-2'-O)-methyltransferase [Kordia sp. SMS9]